MNPLNLSISKGDLPLAFNSFIFPGREIGIKLDTSNLKVKYDNRPYTITAHAQNSNDVFAIALIKDAIERWDSKAIIQLFLPYIPYARQDRVCVGGESFSLKVLTSFIDSLNFVKVTVVDPHSEVSTALFNHLKVISQFNIVDNCRELNNRIGRTILVAPDSGSNKKTAEIAKYLGHSEFVRADKLRDLNTGEIKETIVYKDNFNGADVTILDDICDGGRTFTELAKVLKKKNCGKIILYVTHGIFSKGIETLIDNGIDEIWTTNSFGTIEHPKVNILKLETLFRL